MGQSEEWRVFVRCAHRVEMEYGSMLLQFHFNVNFNITSKQLQRNFKITSNSLKCWRTFPKKRNRRDMSRAGCNDMN